MTTRPPLDAPLLELTDPSVARPLPAPIIRARSAILGAVADLLAIPAGALTLPWAWIGGGEEEVRYGAYRAFEALEQGEIGARLIVAATESTETRAARIIGPATAARWELHGILAGLPDSLLDADPGGGEWPIRAALGHVISAQRAYGWGTAWWQANPHDVADPGLPGALPEGFWVGLPDDAVAAMGPLADVRAALDASLDLGAERLAGIPDDRLALGARWSGFPVTVGFRLGRWSSHIREHTVQVDKTFVMLGREPGEPERLARLVLAAYGRAEATVFGRRPMGPVITAAERITDAALEAADALRAAREAAGM
jgi:hypothetical protein